MGPLGVDGKNRNYYLLDGDTGQILSSSDDDAGDTLEEITPNLLIALNEKREGDESDLTASYMDLALPISRGRRTMSSTSWTSGPPCRELNNQLFQLIIEALVFGLVISVPLSFLLSRAMVTPHPGPDPGSPAGGRGGLWPRDSGGVPRRDRRAHQRLQRHVPPAPVHPCRRWRASGPSSPPSSST